MQSVGAAAANAVVALLRALRDREEAKVFASWTSAWSASSLVKPSGSSCRSERILPGMIVELGFSVGVHLTKGSFAPGLAAAGVSVLDEVVDASLDADGGVSAEGESPGGGVVDEGVVDPDAGASDGVVELGARRSTEDSVIVVGAVLVVFGVVVALGVGVGVVVG